MISADQRRLAVSLLRPLFSFFRFFRLSTLQDLSLPDLRPWGMHSNVNLGRMCLVFLSCIGLSGACLHAQTPKKEPAEPELKQLQQQVTDRERGAKPTTNAVPSTLGTGLSFKEIEQLFLDGKISARQFQEYVQKLPAVKAPTNAVPATPAWPKASRAAVTNKPPIIVTNAVTKIPKVPQPQPEALTPEAQQKAVEILRATEPNPANNPKPGPAIQASQLAPLKEEVAPPVDPIEQGFSEIEAKMDELLRFKAAREKAAQTNAAPSKAAGATVTKRQRLDELLKLYIAGDIKEEDYKARRAAIIAEPEAK